MQAPAIQAASTARASTPGSSEGGHRTRAGRAWPFLLAAGIASIPLTVQTLQTHWSTDAWLHAASILELSEHPLDPGHPTVDAVAGDPDLSPYSWLWGLVHRGSGVDVLTVMIVAGLANLAALWGGLWMLASRLTRARLAPAFTVLAMLLVWGFGPWRWSGYPNLNSLGFGLPYASFAALAAYLTALALFLDWLREPRLRRAWLIAALGAAVTLIHPITGAALALGVLTLLAVAMWTRRLPRRAALAQLAVPALVALGAVLAWPFYSFGLLVENADVYTAANAGAIRQVLPRAALGLACVPVAIVLGRRRGDWRLVALALPPLALVATGVALDVPVLGRFMPFGLPPLQIALADAVAGGVPAGARLRRPRLVGGTALAVAGLVGTASALVYMVPEPLLPSRLRDDARLESIRDEAGTARGLGRGMAVIAPQNDVARRLLASGAKVVNPPFAAPEIEDADARDRAVSDFLEGSPDRQRRTITDYGATHLVVADDLAARVNVAELGTVVSSTDDRVVVRLDVSSGDGRDHGSR